MAKQNVAANIVMSSFESLDKRLNAVQIHYRTETAYRCCPLKVVRTAHQNSEDPRAELGSRQRHARDGVRSKSGVSHVRLKLPRLGNPEVVQVQPGNRREQFVDIGHETLRADPPCRRGLSLSRERDHQGGHDHVDGGRRLGEGPELANVSARQLVDSSLGAHESETFPRYGIA